MRWPVSRVTVCLVLVPTAGLAARTLIVGRLIVTVRLGSTECAARTPSLITFVNVKTVMVLHTNLINRTIASSLCNKTVFLTGGTCSKSTGDCLCAPGFYGSKCSSTSSQDAINSVCSTVVCSNGGTCVPNKPPIFSPAYSCVCPLGWAGDFCTVPVNICATLPCANGGTCTPLPENKYKCECPRHFGGPDCSEPCDCHNGATCEVANVCICAPGFTGNKCQVATNQTFTPGPHYAAVQEDTLSASHVILVVCVSVATPLLVVVAVAVVLILKKRKRAEQKRNDELARKQNEQNTLHCVTKKCIDQHMIVNTFEDGGSSSARTSNKCSNLDLSFKADLVQNSKNYKCASEFNRNNSNSNVNNDASCSSHTNESKA